ncbi:M14 family metallopeptidase [Phenylobacterium sp. VNQ135]|uniref:M14 family metallopeptidase n=1 Tax=Phenylobacterium sp. VNQ135 TaxID=3400922 RepID=UPI003BFFC116
MRHKMLAASALALALALHGPAGSAVAAPASATTPARLPITTPRQAYGFGIGDDYQLANYKQMAAYWTRLAGESDRMKLTTIGKTSEGRDQLMAVVSSPENLRNVEKYRQIAKRLSQAEGLSDAEARQLAREGKAVVWIDGGLHSTETVSTQQLTQTLYEMLSGKDPETLRILDNCIILFAHANPDGNDLVSDWYMRNKEPAKREFDSLPRLYNWYVGHDNNRDFFMSNMKETVNINRILYREWFPQIVYNHHQSGPPGTVVFIPPHRNPYNYALNPLVLTGLDQVGARMLDRLIAEGKPGGVRREYAAYTNWAGTTLRANALFHNSIGVITEIIGSPTPAQLELVPRQQLPTNDNLTPIAPRVFKFQDGIDYSVALNRGMLDYASSNREHLLYSIYRMGKDNIDRGSSDHWTVNPRRIAALEAAAKGGTYKQDVPRWGMGYAPDAVDPSLYDKVIKAPDQRDPRGYILSADQADYPRVVVFMNSLIKSGLKVERATQPFSVGGKSYPAGSFIVKTAQAYRAQVMDMFEAQFHPDNIPYPGAPPIRPHNVTGYTLAYQMGVQFDRILDGFDAPTEVVADVMAPPSGRIVGSGKAGYVISHEINNAFIVQNRLLKAHKTVEWLTAGVDVGGKAFAPGALWVPEGPGVRAILETAAQQTGVDIYAVDAKPASASLPMKPIRIGLVDLYGGVMASGWNRWLFESYEFPFEVVFPQQLDAGNLKAKYDVLVFADETVLEPPSPERPRRGQPAPGDIPAEWRAKLGHVTKEKTAPQLAAFAKAGGTIVAIGSATQLAEDLGLPVKDALVTVENGQTKHLPASKFYVPGSVLVNKVDNTRPLAFGLPPEVNVYYYNSPAFKAEAGATPIAWFDRPDPLRSGWAWGAQHLNGAASILETDLGRGKVFLMGPEVTQLGQSQGTYAFLFNSLYYGPAAAGR